MCFRKHRKDAGSCCENSCENCQCFGVWLSQLQLLRYLILHRIFKKETVTMSRNLRSESGRGGNVFSRECCVWDFAFAKSGKNRKNWGEKKEVNFFYQTFSHRMISEAEALVSICANLQFGEVCEYHRGSFRIKWLDRSDPDSAQRNQKENLGHCWHFQDYINNCVASLTLYSL